MGDGAPRWCIRGLDGGARTTAGKTAAAATGGRQTAESSSQRDEYGDVSRGDSGEV